MIEENKEPVFLPIAEEEIIFRCYYLTSAQIGALEYNFPALLGTYDRQTDRLANCPSASWTNHQTERHEKGSKGSYTSINIGTDNSLITAVETTETSAKSVVK